MLDRALGPVCQDAKSFWIYDLVVSYHETIWKPRGDGANFYSKGRIVVAMGSRVDVRAKTFALPAFAPSAFALRAVAQATASPRRMNVNDFQCKRFPLCL